MTTLLALIARDTPLKRTSSCHGGEYSGPCPLCRRGTDRFKVWEQLGRWACLGPDAGRNGCGRGGDAIQYLRERDGLSYREACARLHIEPKEQAGSARRQSGKEPAQPARTAPPRPALEDACPPNDRWQAHGRGIAARCEALLWRAEGAAARQYLHSRGLEDAVLRWAHIGYNPHDLHEHHAAWGLAQPAGGARTVWLPRGITIPWFVDGVLWRLNVRRPLSRREIAGGAAKYIGPAGFGNALYNAGALARGGDAAPARPAPRPAPRPVVLVEGEFDALTVAQACGDLVAAVATGSTAGARHQPWLDWLAAAPCVLVAFDHDPAQGDLPGAGDRAAAWWLAALPNAHRWQPPLHDVNSRPDPQAVAAWVAGGIAAY